MGFQIGAKFVSLFTRWVQKNNWLHSHSPLQLSCPKPSHFGPITGLITGAWPPWSLQTWSAPPRDQRCNGRACTANTRGNAANTCLHHRRSLAPLFGGQQLRSQLFCCLDKIAFRMPVSCVIQNYIKKLHKQASNLKQDEPKHFIEEGPLKLPFFKSSHKSYSTFL